MEGSARTGRDRSVPGAVVAWTLYDFAGTIFSVSILSYFFLLWLGDELGGGADLFNYLRWPPPCSS